MSRHLLEKALWQLSVERSAKQRFRDDPDGFLKRFNLSDEEKRWVREFDVGALQAAGVNPMLTMGFWQELSPDRSMRRYKERLGASGEALNSFSAALKKG
ncbi:Extradiol ring-cleavage dioxygenase, class III enzyme subunit A [Alcanivorax sp. S71-1-4]|uniref:extradiol ring-cleavage dioxygenase n=1 Tax=Alcanivorax sp. S71-1-4 TaxID=1177159 RepID=UPI00135B8877|nr:extradiol ring-cleavage dioxygenase [Alcanivorax sp. S71-1-4]KAF0808710.1 Extradiol ring-cleavage dioxygenase, class III enzyme subunit A [Alcanivorax sp. S71-1-4]